MTEPVKAALLSAARADPSVRTEVMNDLLRVGAPEGMNLAREALTGDDPAAASLAVAALAENGSSDARAMIQRAAGSRTPEVQRVAIQVLARENDARSTETLVGLTRDGDVSVRAQAVAALAQNDSSHARQAIVDASRSADPSERVAALGGLAAHSDDPRSARQLASMMHDADPDVAGAAIAYARNGDNEVMQRELEQVARDQGASPDLRELAVEALRARGVEIDSP
jgi:HEAT repeat protein